VRYIGVFLVDLGEFPTYEAAEAAAVDLHDRLTNENRMVGVVAGDIDDTSTRVNAVYEGGQQT
jgi:hypothetical protein